MAGHKSKKQKGPQRPAQRTAQAAKSAGASGDQLAEDVHQAWVLASNCAIYEADPGPAQVNIGTAEKPVTVSWAESWRISYARQLLTELDVDAARINAAGAGCIARGAETGDRDYTLAAELCRRAVFMVEQAGADRDATARRRLEAVAGYHNQVATFAMMGMGGSSLAGDARQEMEQELRRIPGDPDLETLTALVTGARSAAAAAPAPSRQRILESFATEGAGPRVRELLVDQATRDKLGPEALAEIASSLWAVDCQTCGRPLGDEAPALKLQRLPGERIAAGLHHDACVPTVADWTSINSNQLPEQWHNSWSSLSMVMKPAPGDPVPGGYPVLMVNPSLENVGLRQDSDGHWRVDVASDFNHLGLISPGESARAAGEVAVPRVSDAVARVTGDSIAVTIQTGPGQTFEAPADAAVREAAKAFGGVILAATHDLWLGGDLDEDTLAALWGSDRIRLGMVELHGTARPKQARSVDATFVLQWNPRILTVGVLLAHHQDGISDDEAKAWAETAVKAGAPGDVALIDWRPSDADRSADGWYTLDAISSAMFALRRHDDGWRLVRCFARHSFANEYTDNEAKAWAAGILDRHGIAAPAWTPGPTTAGSTTLYAVTRAED